MPAIIPQPPQRFTQDISKSTQLLALLQAFSLAPVHLILPAQIVSLESDRTGFTLHFTT